MISTACSKRWGMAAMEAAYLCNHTSYRSATVAASGKSKAAVLGDLEEGDAGAITPSQEVDVVFGQHDLSSDPSMVRGSHPWGTKSLAKGVSRSSIGVVSATTGSGFDAGEDRFHQSLVLLGPIDLESDGHFIEMSLGPDKKRVMARITPAGAETISLVFPDGRRFSPKHVKGAPGFL